jgi:hypothetical protein
VSVPSIVASAEDDGGDGIDGRKLEPGQYVASTRA